MQRAAKRTSSVRVPDVALNFGHGKHAPFSRRFHVPTQMSCARTRRRNESGRRQRWKRISLMCHVGDWARAADLCTSRWSCAQTVRVYDSPMRWQRTPQRSEKGPMNSLQPMDSLRQWRLLRLQHKGTLGARRCSGRPVRPGPWGRWCH